MTPDITIAQVKDAIDQLTKALRRTALYSLHLKDAVERGIPIDNDVRWKRLDPIEQIMRSSIEAIPTLQVPPPNLQSPLSESAIHDAYVKSGSYIEFVRIIEQRHGIDFPK